MTEALWRDGYVVVDLINDSHLDELRRAFGSLTPDDRFTPDTNRTSQYHCTFVDKNDDYRRQVDVVSRAFMEPLLPTLMPQYKILTSNFYVKPPGRGQFEVHQNWITTSDPADLTLTAWVPLRETNAINGTIHVVPGSHRLYPDIATAASVQYFENFTDDLIAHHLHPIDLQAGQAVIFDDTLLHWSPHNLSAYPRAALQIELVPSWATTAIWIPDPEDARWFDVYQMDSRFWYTQQKEVFYGRPDLPVVNRVPNPNRRVAYAEFCERLASGAAVRARTYRLSSKPA